MTSPPAGATASWLPDPGDGPAGGAPGSRARTALRVLLVLVLLAGVAAVGWNAAQVSRIRAPVLSQQLNGTGPLANVVQDQGSSVALPDGRTLWLFADTAKLTGRPQFFVTSSAGVAAGRSLTLDYLTGEGGSPIEFLPRTAAERAGQVQGDHYTAVWPTGATTLPDGRIVIAYAKYEVHLKPAAQFTFVGGGLYEYRFQRVTLAADARPATRLADDIWTPADGPVASPLYFGGQVYFLRCEDFVCYSLRTTPAELGDRSSYQWWTGSGWSPDQNRRQRLVFGSDVPGRNPSVAYSPALGLFTMADTSGGIQSTQGRLWVAKHPQGPWSRAAAFPLPECPADGCYTLNVHPDQSAAGTLRVSFATAGTGPYVRVVDVPVQVNPGGEVPSIRTHAGSLDPLGGGG